AWGREEAQQVMGTECPGMSDGVARHLFRVSQVDAGNRLDDYLASEIGWLSRIRIGRLIASGHCLVNGVPARPGKKMLAGDSVELTEPDGPPTAMTPEPIRLEILHEDDHLLVVVKP